MLLNKCILEVFVLTISNNPLNQVWWANSFLDDIKLQVQLLLM